MITNFKTLSEALDNAAPNQAESVREVVSAIRNQKARIDTDIQRSGEAFVTVDGCKFKVVRPSSSAR
jgi:hypothetical protein